MANLSVYSGPNARMYQSWRGTITELPVRIHTLSINPGRFQTILKISTEPDFKNCLWFESGRYRDVYIAIRTNPKTVCVCNLRYISYFTDYPSNNILIAFEILPVREEDINKPNLQQLFDAVMKDFSYTDYTSFYKGDTTMLTNDLFRPEYLTNTNNDCVKINIPNSDVTTVTTKTFDSFVKDNPMMVKNMLFGTKLPAIRKVIYNDPATIIYWADDTKTVVKAAYHDTFNKEDGLAHAIAKKYFECMEFEHPRSMFKTVVENAVDLSARTKDRLAKKEKIKLLKAAEENTDGE